MIDMQGEKVRESLWDVLAEINQWLHEVFLSISVKVIFQKMAIIIGKSI